MNKLIALLCVLSSLSICFGQNLTTYQTTAVAGQSATDQDLYVNWTIGEALSFNGQANDIHVGQGWVDHIWRISLLLDDGHEPHPFSTRLTCFPNPAIDILNVELSEPLDMHVKIFNMEGRLIRKSQGIGKVSIDLRDINASMLVAQVFDGDFRMIGQYKIAKVNY